MNNHMIDIAIKRIKAFAPPDKEPYYVCYSGGKDSDCIRILCELANIPYELEYSLTTADAPETVNYIRSIPNVHINKPKLSMWQLIPKKKIPPTRLIRYCCSELKEKSGVGRLKMTGVRAAESKSRAINGGYAKIIGRERFSRGLSEEIGSNFKVNESGGLVLNFDNPTNADRNLIYTCYRTTSTLINPILDWSDDDVWQFLDYFGCKSNPLYQCGFSRVGCVGCPLGGFASQHKEFELYPKYKAHYIRAFDRMLKVRKESGLSCYSSWIDGYHVFKWWIGDDPFQLSFFDEAIDYDDSIEWGLPFLTEEGLINE